MGNIANICTSADDNDINEWLAFQEQLESERTGTMPIYYVIAEYTPMPMHPGIAAWKIIKCFSCDLQDIDHLWQTEARPLIAAGRNIQAQIYYREPENPFKDFKEVN